MYYSISLFAGILIAVMIVANGELAERIGIYGAAVFIHLSGLLFTALLLAAAKKRFRTAAGIPLHLYLGGTVGVGTTLFNNMAFGKISVSAILALCLLGQILTSVVIDHWGLWHTRRRPFQKKKIAGMLWVLSGVAFMLFPAESRIFLPAILSLASGVTIVVARTINASLSEKTGALQSTFYNYLTGLALSALVFLAAGGGEPLSTGFTAAPVFSPAYWGGPISVCVVFLANITVKKISSFYMTLLLFTGQILAGSALDWAITGALCEKNLIGALLAATGLCFNLLADGKTGTGGKSFGSVRENIRR